VLVEDVQLIIRPGWIRVPDPRGVVVGGAGDVPAVGTEGDVVDAPRMAAQVLDRIARAAAEVPDADVVVGAALNEPGAGGVVGDRARPVRGGERAGRIGDQAEQLVVVEYVPGLTFVNRIGLDLNDANGAERRGKLGGLLLQHPDDICVERPFDRVGIGCPDLRSGPCRGQSPRRAARCATRRL
jgi:hypothetical protein